MFFGVVKIFGLSGSAGGNLVVAQNPAIPGVSLRREGAATVSRYWPMGFIHPFICL